MASTDVRVRRSPQIDGALCMGCGRDDNAATATPRDLERVLVTTRAVHLRLCMMCTHALALKLVMYLHPEVADSMQKRARKAATSTPER